MCLQAYKKFKLPKEKEQESNLNEEGRCNTYFAELKSSLKSWLKCCEKDIKSLDVDAKEELRQIVFREIKRKITFDKTLPDKS